MSFGLFSYAASTVKSAASGISHASAHSIARFTLSASNGFIAISFSHSNRAISFLPALRNPWIFTRSILHLKSRTCSAKLPFRSERKRAIWASRKTFRAFEKPGTSFTHCVRRSTAISQLCR